jgi:serine/threonine-protein kinase RsbW
MITRRRPSGKGTQERRFNRRLDAAEDISVFVSDFTARHDVSDSVAFKLNLAVEELFVNMVKYNPQNRNDILIGLAKGADRLVVSMTDFGVEPFDITKADEYDTTRPLEKRPIGGLGIHLARSMVDEIAYRYENGQSRITLIKHLGKANVQDRPTRE